MIRIRLVFVPLCVSCTAATRMTRFVGESLSTRPGRSSKALLGKDRDKAMKEFLETGKHPIIEKTVQENASSALQPLPTLDINRPHIFLDLQQQGKPLRRIIVELFEDLFPVVGAAFRHRCMEVSLPVLPHIGSVCAQQRMSCWSQW